MQIWPAIDLRGGKCVRLKQGDYNRETVYADDPVAMAKRWVSEGASCLHLVDLDGARDGDQANRSAVAAIVAAVEIPCELGGGIRDDATIDAYLELGLERLVVGTSAIKRPVWFRQACRRWPDRLVLGVDARDGYVATDGWLETSRLEAVEFARSFSDERLAAIVYTDIAKDGMMQGPNLSAMEAMDTAVSLPVVASGGVTTVDDVRRLAELDLAGCIIGRTLYEGGMTLGEALDAAAQGTRLDPNSNTSVNSPD